MVLEIASLPPSPRLRRDRSLAMTGSGPAGFPHPRRLRPIGGAASSAGRGGKTESSGVSFRGAARRAGRPVRPGCPAAEAY